MLEYVDDTDERIIYGGSWDTKGAKGTHLESEYNHTIHGGTKSDSAQCTFTFTFVGGFFLLRLL